MPAKSVRRSSDGTARSGRCDDPMIESHLVHLASRVGGELHLPLQLHVGLGDPDLTLHDVNPTLLTPLIRAHPQCTFALLHCWPFERRRGVSGDRVRQRRLRRRIGPQPRRAVGPGGDGQVAGDRAVQPRAVRKRRVRCRRTAPGRSRAVPLGIGVKLDGWMDGWACSAADAETIISGDLGHQCHGGVPAAGRLTGVVTRLTVGPIQWFAVLTAAFAGGAAILEVGRDHRAWSVFVQSAIGLAAAALAYGHRRMGGRLGVLWGVAQAVVLPSTGPAGSVASSSSPTSARGHRTRDLQRDGDRPQRNGRVPGLRMGLVPVEGT